MGRIRQFIYRILRNKLEIDYINDRLEILEEELVELRKTIEEIRVEND